MAAPIDTEILSEQLRLTQELSVATREMAAAMADAAKSMSSQLDVSRQIADTLKGILDIKGIITAIESIGEKLQQIVDMVKQLGVVGSGTGKNVTLLAGNVGQLGQGAGQAGRNVGDLGQGLAKTDHNLKSFLYSFQKMNPKTWAAIIGGIKGFTSALGGIVAISKSLFGIFKGLVSGAFNVAAAIIAIPFKLFKGLIDLANSGGGSNELAQAWEEVRDQFGSLKGDIPQTFRSLLYNSSAFRDVGLSIRRVYGSLAEYLKELNEIAKASGAIFNNFHKEIEESEGAILGIGRGMGFTAEDYGVVMGHALSFGKQLGELQIDMHKQSFDMAKDFDLVAKDINRDVIKAMKDVKNFGGATIQELNKAAVYARKLGLELEKISGLLESFETFEGAAEAVSKLNQQFNTQFDAIKMVKMQNVGEMAEEVKKQFAAQGVSVEKLNRQHYSFLQGILKIDAAQIRQLISTHNQGVSMDKINQKSKEAEKRTLSQADAMKELADAIKRTIPSGSARQGGYFSQYFQGFIWGIRYSKEFRGLLREVRRGLREAFRAGIELGRDFVKSFPGVLNMINGLKKVLDRGNIRSLFRGMNQEFKWFMKTLSSSDSPASFTMLMDRLKKRFFDFFNAGTPGGKQFLDGLKRFNKAVVTIISGMIRWMADNVKEGIMMMIDLVTGKKKLTDGGAGSFLMAAFAPIGEALVYAWQELSPILMDLLRQLGEKIYNFLATNLPPLIGKAAPFVLGYLFTSAAISAVVGAAAVGISSLLGKALAKIFLKKNPVTNAAASAAANAGKKTATTATRSAEHLACMAKMKAIKCEEAVLIAQKKLATQQLIFANSSSGMAFGAKEAWALAKKLFLYAFVFGVAGVAFATAFALMAGILAGVGLGGVLTVMGLLVSIALSSALVLLAFEGVQEAQVVFASRKLLTLSGFLGLAALTLMPAIIGMAAAVSLIGPGNVLVAVVAMAAMVAISSVIITALAAIPDALIPKSISSAFTLGFFLLAITASLVPAIVLMAGAFQMLSVDWNSLIKAVFALAAVSLMMTFVIPAIMASGLMAPGAIAPSWGLAAFIAIGLVALGAAIWLLYKASQGIKDINRLQSVVESMALMALIALPLMFAVIAAGILSVLAIPGALALALFFLIAGYSLLGSLTALTKTDFDFKKIMGVLLALNMVALLAVPLAVAAVYAAIFAVKAIIGMMVLNLFLRMAINTMIELSEKVKDAGSKINPSSTKALIDLTLGLAKMMIFLAPVLAVAAVAGTFIVGTLGIGALILAAGFKAMINAMGSVTQAAISIMTILNTMPVNTDIGRKSEAFATILKSLSDILNVIGVMTEKLMPEIDNVWDLIWGSSFTDKLIIVAGIINDMIGSANKGTGIMGIVKTISDSLTGMARLPASPVVDAFVKIMKVLPDIITAMTPSEEMMDALTGFWVKVDPEDVKSMSTSHIGAVGGQLVQVIGAVSLGMQSLLAIPVPNPESANAVSTIFSSFVKLIGALTPPPAFISAFKDNDGEFDDIEEAGISMIMETFMKNVGLIMDKIAGVSGKGGILDSIFASIAQVDIGKLKQVAAPISMIFGGVADLISSVAKAMSVSSENLKSADLIKAGGEAKVEVENVTVNLPPIAKITDQLAGLGPALSTIIDSLRMAVNSFPDAPDLGSFMQKTSALGQVLSVVSKIPEIAKIILEFENEFKKENSSGVNPVDAVAGWASQKTEEAKTVSGLSVVMKNLSDVLATEMQTAMTHMIKAIELLPKGPDFQNQVISMEKMFGILKQIPELAKTLKGIDYNVKKTEGPAEDAKDKAKNVVESAEKQGNIFSEVIANLLSIINDQPDGKPSAFMSAMGKLKDFINSSFSVTVGKDGKIEDIFSKKLDSFVKMFDVMKSFPEMAKTIKEINYVTTTQKNGTEGGNSYEWSETKLLETVTKDSTVFQEQLGILSSIITPDSQFMGAVKRLQDFISQTMPSGKDGKAFEAKLKAATSLFKIIESFPQMATTLSNLGKQAEGAAAGGPPTTSSYGQDLPTIMGKFAEDLEKLTSGVVGEKTSGAFNRIIDSIGILYTNIKGTKVGARGNVSIETALPFVTKFMDNISKISGSIGTLMSTVSNMPPIDDKPAEGGGTKKTFAQVSEELSEKIGGITRDLGTFDISSKVSELTREINSKGGLTQMDGTTKKLNAYVTSLNSLVSSLNGWSDIVELKTSTPPILTGLSTKIQEVVGTFQRENINANLQALKAIIASVADVHHTISTLPPIDIFAPLNTLAKGMGIGGEYKFDPIEHKQVQLNINMQVLIKASDVEDAILMNSQSVIRENINFATQNPSDKAARAILQSNPRAALNPTAAGN